MAVNTYTLIAVHPSGGVFSFRAMSQFTVKCGSC